jgi:outer membrane protein assembly factor BamB
MSETNSPNTLWTAELEQTVIQPPVVLGDLLLVASQPSGTTAQHGLVSAVSLADGALRWQKTFEYSLVSGLETHHWRGQEVVIVTSSSSDFLKGRGNLLALNMAGEEVWRWPAEEEHFSAPAMLGDSVVVVVGGRTLALVELHGGGELRIPLAVPASLSAPLVVDDVAYISCRSADLLAIGLNGEEQWHFTFAGDKQDWLDKRPVIVEASVIATSSRGSIYVLEQATGKLIWHEVLSGERNTSPPATDGEDLYVGYQQGVVALAVSNGRTHWTFPTSRPVSARPLVLCDHLLLTSEDHKLYLLDKKSGTEQWRFELPRRIEVPPLLTESAILVADRGGSIVALERPSELTAEPAAEPVVDTAVTRERHRQDAERFEQERQFLKAAELWHELGELEQAAGQYEAGQDWLSASKLWRQLDHYGKQAEALKRHAQHLSLSQAANEEKAAAWENAARVFAEMGEKDERAAGEREIARYRGLPILNIEIEAEEMSKNAWAKVLYTIRNEGYGTAQYLTVQLNDDRFEGQMSATQAMVSVAVGRESTGRLEVRPRHQGSSVPMQINIEYMDKSGLQKLERIFYLPVAGEITQIVTGPLDTGALGATGSREALAQLPAPDGVNLFDFRNKLVKYFSREELIEVVFELGLSEDDFSERLSTMARELITALARSGRIEALIVICERDRSHVTWRNG